ncbi:MAG TPA: type II secretion system minor pseudopilin GspI [Gammaproteobacteria bacterium]|nr:type II secretion system minor pseudopilin GspI [Gammaproteobacteria bacterium]
MKTPGRQAGFTLMEVLVALAVLALGMLAVIGAGGTTARNTAYLRDDTFASWVGLNELTMLRVAQTWPSADTLDGDADMAGEKWHWKATMSKTSDPGLLRIDIDVSTPDKPDSPVTRVTGFMGLPAGQQGGRGP